LLSINKDGNVTQKQVYLYGDPLTGKLPIKSLELKNHTRVQLFNTTQLLITTQLRTNFDTRITFGK
jgi:hypothetical protein